MKSKSIYFVIALGIITTLIIIIGFHNLYKTDEETMKRIEEARIESEKRRVEEERRKSEEEKVKAELNKLKRPLLVLTFDDGFETDYTVAYPLLKKRGISGTSFINGGHIDNQQGKVRRMSWQQVKEISNNGWDIQSHTFSHRRLSELEEDEIESEFKNDDIIFEQNGLERPQHTAYPYGDYDEIVRKIGEEYRKTLRRINPSGSTPYNSWENVDFHNLTARNTDIYDGNIERLDERKRDIDLAIENKGILIFFSHEMKMDDAVRYETKIGYYEELIDYALEKGIEFVTMSEMYDLVSDFQELLQ